MKAKPKPYATSTTPVEEHDGSEALVEPEDQIQIRDLTDAKQIRQYDDYSIQALEVGDLYAGPNGSLMEVKDIDNRGNSKKVTLKNGYQFFTRKPDKYAEGGLWTDDTRLTIWRPLRKFREAF